MDKLINKTLKYLLVAAATLTMCRIGQHFAILERGGRAVGGEYLIIAFPFLYIIAKNTVSQILETLKKENSPQECELFTKK